VLERRIAAFIEDPASERFEDLALAAFAFQRQRVAAYRQLCERRGVSPATLDDWRDVPAVPTAAFKTLELHSAPPVVTFRSSGTTAGEKRSVHRHPFPDLYRLTIERSFPEHCLPPPAPRAPMLSLVPPPELVPDSSLGFMVEHVLARWGGPESLTAVSARGVEVARARSWLGARQREGRPVVVLATALALADLLDALARLGLRFRLPAGSVVFETGGFKGRRREVERSELLRRIAETLGLQSGRVVREYGMTELTSQFYTRALVGEDPDRFAPPHWTRARVLDPETLREVESGAGLLALFDLANLGSAVHLLTEDLAERDGDGFRLCGRAAGAELRGCSLTLEELAAAGGDR
jgi:hypothetical protein